MSSPTPGSRAAHAAPGASAAADRPSLPLSSRSASMLAYSAGWLSGLLVLALEARRPDVRYHAAQSLVGFGLLSLLVLTVLAVAGISLFVSITVFRVLLWVAQAIVLVGVLCWLFALVQAARGASWHWPVVAPYAERLARLGR